MTLTEQVYAQALLMYKGLEEEKQALLQALCASAVATVKQRLRPSVEPEDCLADFVTAGAMYALAAMNELGAIRRQEETAESTENTEGLEGLAGEESRESSNRREKVTITTLDTEDAGSCLRYQAELLMLPYVNDRFAFQGV
jgi:hypothetical protein